MTINQAATAIGMNKMRNLRKFAYEAEVYLFYEHTEQAKLPIQKKNHVTAMNMKITLRNPPWLS